jgi:hypothetical protein
LEEDKDLDDITLQQYLDIYRKPLSQSVIFAVKKLTEMAQMKKKKKRAGQSKSKKRMTTNAPKASKGKKAAAAT